MVEEVSDTVGWGGMHDTRLDIYIDTRYEIRDIGEIRDRRETEGIEDTEEI